MEIQILKGAERMNFKIFFIALPAAAITGRLRQKDSDSSLRASFGTAELNFNQTLAVEP